MTHRARSRAFAPRSDKINAHAIRAEFLRPRRRFSAGVAEITKEPPEDRALAPIHAVECIPWTAGALHLDDYKRPSIGCEHQEISLVARIAGTAPVPCDRAISECAQKSFSGALACITRAWCNPESSQNLADHAEQIERGKQWAVAREVRSHCCEMLTGEKTGARIGVALRAS